MNRTTNKSCDCLPVKDSRNLYSLPFFTQFSNNKSTCNQECTQNLNVLPRGPVIPTRPIFPAALPPSYSNYPSAVETQFITVRQQACICDLRVSCLIVNGGELNPDGSGGTTLKIKNLPKVSDAGNKYSQLVVDKFGQVFSVEP